MSRKEFADLGKELEKWPTDWTPKLDARSEWSGVWGCTGSDGERTEVDGSIVGSDDPEDFAKFVAQLVNTAPTVLGHVSALEAAIRETIPVLERAGRMVLAVKLRKLVDG